MRSHKSVDKQGSQARTAHDLINLCMQEGAQEVATSYTADLIYEIMCADGLSEEAKIERIKAELDNYRVGVLKSLGRN